MFQRIPLYVQHGYIVCFEAVPEDVDFEQHFTGDCGWSQDEFTAIADSAWFTAKVSLWRDGVEVASDYLGACCYKQASDFYTVYAQDYFADMVTTCFKDLRL